MNEQIDAVLEDALRLATVGLIPSFPCLPDKRPACPHGFKDATKDPEQLKALWQRFPGSLVGVPTGEASSVFVLDIDSTKHRAADEWLERHAPYLPETRMHRTRSGGLHFLFKHEPGFKNSASKLAAGVDTRGEGGFIIWWPFHLGINAGHQLISLAPVPEWLLKALQPQPPSRKVIPFPKIARTRFGNVDSAKARLEGIAATVARAPQGQRNAITYWGACRLRDMIAARELDYKTAHHAVDILVEAASRTGLPHHEIRRTIMSATKGAQ